MADQDIYIPLVSLIIGFILGYASSSYISKRDSWSKIDQDEEMNNTYQLNYAVYKNGLNQLRVNIRLRNMITGKVCDIRQLKIKNSEIDNISLKRFYENGLGEL